MSKIDKYGYPKGLIDHEKVSKEVDKKLPSIIESQMFFIWTPYSLIEEEPVELIRRLNYNQSTMNRAFLDKRYGFPIRCLKD
jgi:hypothetical protein